MFKSLIHIFQSLFFLASKPFNLVKMRLSWASVVLGASCFVLNVFAYDPTDSIMDGGPRSLVFGVGVRTTC